MGLSLKNHQSMTLTMTFRSERLVYRRLAPHGPSAPNCRFVAV